MQLPSIAIILAAFVTLCAAAKSKTTSNNNAWVLEVNTPTLTQCKSGYLSWAGKYSPFNVSIINQKNGDYLKSFGAVAGTNYTWTVDLPAGRNVALKVIDAKGNINYSNGLYVKNSTDSTCVTSAVDVSGNATVTPDTMPTIAGNASSPGVSSGAIGPNAAATTSNQVSSSSRLTAGLGLLLSCSLIALVA
ncbi:hypothetical protein P389DRAFT_173679 [Cystobasidium minutum MCA 4210]|uniref:uncharacterized protein n=1 Tax=Cystobasidium minutum MCA 4210 TaxID=1397322 RepID=UPI0034CD7E9E|eukprot:jgi/Rhomi1/173679/fgenesh1_kg.6_\